MAAKKKELAAARDEALDELTRIIAELDRYGRHEAAIVRALAVVVLELRALREAVSK